MALALKMFCRHNITWFIQHQCGRVVLRCSHNVVTGPKKKTRAKKQRYHSNNEVVKYIKKHFIGDFNKKDTETCVLNVDRNKILHSLQTNRSQILGFSLEELKRRINLFQTFQISMNDCIILSLTIPSCLNICNNNFKKMILLLQSYELPIEEILYNFPFVGAFDHRQVKRNLELLTVELNVKAELLDIISKNPLLLSYMLNKHSVQLLLGSSFTLNPGHTIATNIDLSLRKAAIINSVVEDFVAHNGHLNMTESEAKHFLSTYDIDPEKIYIACPEIFLTPRKVLEECSDNLSTEPFFFSAEDIQKLIWTYPKVFMSFHRDDIRRQARYIANVSTTKNRPYKMLSEYPEIFQDPNCFFKRVNIFEKYGIKDGDIGRLFAQKGGTNCFIDCEDFTDTSIIDILDFYATVTDITPLQIVVSAPVSLSLKSQQIVKARLSFLKHQNKVDVIAGNKKKKQSQVTIQSIVRKDLKDFIERICESTMNDFDGFCQKNDLENYKAIYQMS